MHTLRCPPRGYAAPGMNARLCVPVQALSELLLTYGGHAQQAAWMKGKAGPGLSKGIKGLGTIKLPLASRGIYKQ